jgi:hypothetical protein
VTYDRLVVSSINKINRHDITEILLKVALNTIKQTNKHINVYIPVTITHVKESRKIDRKRFVFLCGHDDHVGYI